MDKVKDENDIKILNNTSKTIYVLNSRNDSIFDPYAEYPESTIENNYKISPNDSLVLSDKPRDWKSYIRNSKNGTIKFFVIPTDSVNKYGWKTILNKNIYFKVYDYNLEKLERNNWKIKIDKYNSKG